MKVLVPLCGDSSRFPNLRPKWMLTHPEGELMIERAVGREYPKNLYFVIRKDHEQQYNASKVLYKCFGLDIHILIVDKKPATHNHTIKLGIEHFKLQKESLLIRDSDNYIDYPLFDGKFDTMIVKKIETQEETKGKGMLNGYYSVGGYYVTQAQKFLDYFVKGQPLDVFKSMPFHCDYVEVYRYEDYGTIEEWNKVCDKYKTYFIDIDGVIFKNCSKYFEPYWGNEEPMQKNIDWINSLPKETRVILTTARPHSCRDETLDALAKYNIKFNNLLFDLPHSKRLIINDYTSKETCEAINIKRNEDGSIEKNISNS